MNNCRHSLVSASNSTYCKICNALFLGQSVVYGLAGDTYFASEEEDEYEDVEIEKIEINNNLTNEKLLNNLLDNLDI